MRLAHIRYPFLGLICGRTIVLWLAQTPPLLLVLFLHLCHSRVQALPEVLRFLKNGECVDFGADGHYASW